MNPSNKNSISKQDLLEKYISGEINAEETHLLNQYALEDDFLFESLEGLSSFEDTNASHLLELNARILPKKKGRNFALIYWLSAAASIAIIVASINFLKPFSAELQGESLAMDYKTINEDEDQARLDEAQVQASSIEFDIAEESEQSFTEVKKASKPEISLNSQAKQALKSENKPSAIIINDKEAIAFETIEIPSNISLAPEISTPEPSVSPSPPAIASESRLTLQSANNAGLVAPKSEVKEQSAKIFADASQPQVEIIEPIKIKGLVSTTDGKPIQGSLVFSPEFKIETKTDDKGKFDFTLPGNAKEIKVKYLGFQEKSVEIDRKKDLNIVLTQKEYILNSVEIIDEGTLSKFDPAEILEFRKYIENNINEKILPTQIISGTFEFQVKPNLAIADIKTIVSASYGYDHKLIQLISGYNNWKTVGNNKKARIKIILSDKNQ